NRDPKEIDKIFSAFVIVAEDSKREKNDLDALKPLLLTLSSKSLLEDMVSWGVYLPPLEDVVPRISYQHMEPTNEGSDYLASVAKKIPDDLVKKYALVGRDFGIIREQIEPFVEAGARQVVIFDVHSILSSGS